MVDGVDDHLLLEWGVDKLALIGRSDVELAAEARDAACGLIILVALAQLGYGYLFKFNFHSWILLFATDKYSCVFRSSINSNTSSYKKFLRDSVPVQSQYFKLLGTILV